MVLSENEYIYKISRAVIKVSSLTHQKVVHRLVKNNTELQCGSEGSKKNQDKK